MKKLFAALAAVCVGLAGAGCAQNYAEREVAQGREPASLVVTGAPEGARIVVDGRDYGSMNQHPSGIALSIGRHDVVVISNGAQIHRQAVLVTAGARSEVRIP